MTLLAVLLPWLSFFLRGKIFHGMVCFVLQCTILGWLPAAIWAVVSRSDAKNEERIKKMEQRIINSQKNSLK